MVTVIGGIGVYQPCGWYPAAIVQAQKRVPFPAMPRRFTGRILPAQVLYFQGDARAIAMAIRRLATYCAAAVCGDGKTGKARM